MDPRLEVESMESVRISGRSGLRLPPAASSIFLANNDSISVRCLPDTIEGNRTEVDMAPPVADPEASEDVVGVEDMVL